MRIHVEVNMLAFSRVYINIFVTKHSFKTLVLGSTSYSSSILLQVWYLLHRTTLEPLAGPPYTCNMYRKDKIQALQSSSGAGFLDKKINKFIDSQKPHPCQIFVYESHHYPLLDQVVCLSKDIYLKILNRNLWSSFYSIKLDNRQWTELKYCFIPCNSCKVLFYASSKLSFRNDAKKISSECNINLQDKYQIILLHTQY